MIHAIDENSCPLSQKFSIMVIVSYCLRNLNRFKIFAVPFKIPPDILDFLWSMFLLVSLFNSFKVSLNSFPHNT